MGETSARENYSEENVFIPHGSAANLADFRFSGLPKPPATRAEESELLGSAKPKPTPPAGSIFWFEVEVRCSYQRPGRLR